jgi:hypothetical protein
MLYERKTIEANVEGTLQLLPVGSAIRSLWEMIIALKGKQSW